MPDRQPPGLSEAGLPDCSEPAAWNEEHRLVALAEFAILDTERDTPSELHAYRGRQELPLKNWTLLTGKADDVRELAALLGVNYQKDSRGQFSHSNVITVLNSEGEIAHQLVGLNQPVAEVVKALGSSATPAR